MIFRKSIRILTINFGSMKKTFEEKLIELREAREKRKRLIYEFEQDLKKESQSALIAFICIIILFAISSICML
jgi:hypothetical protein